MIRGCALVGVALALSAAACNSNDQAGDTLVPLPGVSRPPPSTPTSPPVATETQAAPTSSTTETTLRSVEPGEIVLRTDGLGAADFGDAPAETIDEMTSLLGSEPSFDSGWTDPASIGGCPGRQARAVAWGSLTLYFSDESEVASRRRHFFSYYYGENDRFDAPPTGLATVESLTVGATVAELRRAFDDVAIFPPDPSYPATFITSNGLFGVVTGERNRDRVAVIAGGMGCGR
jgi:hypothetical protein